LYSHGKPRAAGRIALHQTLHGYGDGHQLVASSLKLTREDESQLLVMSDLSGPSFRSGFDSYLTAYPLSGGDNYCIARTWFAPELPRPGCVWTHSILIPKDGLADIYDCASILRLFRRPKSTRDHTEYSLRLHLGPSDIEAVDASPRIAAEVLRHLYDTSQTVVLLSDTAQRYESLALKILSQQWPRQRMMFRFCTGALGVREDSTFDLIVAPEGSARRTGSESAAVLRPDELPDSHQGNLEDRWLHVALEDLLGTNSNSELRQFLWRFGSECPNGRSVYRALCEIQLAASQQSAGIEQVLSVVAHFFSSPGVSRRESTPQG